VRSVAEPSSPRLAAPPDLAVELLRERVVSETAMLLLGVEPRSGLDVRIRDRFETIGALLPPLARRDDVKAVIGIDPARARDTAIGHIILSHLGYPDPGFDALLEQTPAMSPNLGSERLPHRLLEQAWLARLCDIVESPTR